MDFQISISNSNQNYIQRLHVWYNGSSFFGKIIKLKEYFDKKMLIIAQIIAAIVWEVFSLPFSPCVIGFVGGMCVGQMAVQITSDRNIFLLSPVVKKFKKMGKKEAYASTIALLFSMGLCYQFPNGALGIATLSGFFAGTTFQQKAREQHTTDSSAV